MEVIIRKAIEKDFPQIFQLIREFSVFQNAAEKVTITPEQMRADQDLFRCLIAEDGDQNILGFATYFPAYYSWTGKALYLDDLYVKKEFRGKGIGKKLLDAVINHAKKEQCKKVRWQVSRWNTNAIEFYKKMGAVIDEVEINCDLSVDLVT